MPTPSTAPRVERSIDLEADADEVWRAITEPGQLEGWLGERVEVDMQPGGCGHVIDDDGVHREVLVTAVEPGQRLAWHWWADGGELSSVEITLVPLTPGTRVEVIEMTTGPSATARACAGLPALASALAPAGVRA